MRASTISLKQSPFHRSDLTIGLGVAALALAMLFAWLFWGRALQLAVALTAAGAALTYFRYLEIATALSGFLLLSAIASFLPGSTSLFFVGTLFVLILRKLFAGDLSWRLGSFTLATVLLTTYFQITGLWVDQTLFYNWSLIYRVIPAVLVISELLEDGNRYIALFIGAAFGIIFTSVTTVQSAIGFYTSGVADQIATSVTSIESTRFFGHWPNPNIMAMTLLAFLGGVIALWRSKIHFAIRTLMFLATGAGLVAILISLSRTGVIGCVIIVGMMLAVERRKIALTLVVTVIVTFLLVVLPVDLFGRIAAFAGGGDASSSERLRLLLAGWKIFWNNPVFGGGLGGFQNEVVYIMTYLPEGFLSHNTLVDVAVDGGLLGVGLFVATLTIAASGLSWRNWTIEPGDTMGMLNAGMRASFVATVLSMLTMTSLAFIPFWVFFTGCALFHSVTKSDTLLNRPADR